MPLNARDVAFILTVCGVTTLNVFLVGSITVALPTIGKDLKFTESNLQWPVNIYSLSYGCLLLLFGRIGDIVGGKVMFIAGSLWFAIWSLITAFASNDIFFIVAMALKGIGSAANTPAAIGLCSSYFPPGPNRNTAYTALGIGQPIGFILGLVLGGLLTESSATWRSLFYIQASLSALLTVSSVIVFPKDQGNRRYTKGLDWGGAILSTAGLGLLTYSLSDSTTARKGWSTPQIPSLLSISIAILVAFLYYERWREAKSKSVLMPLSIWRQSSAKMGPLMGVVFFGWWSFNTLNYFFTLYYQQVQLLNPFQTSLRFVPMALSGILPNLAAGFFMSRIPAPVLMVIGTLSTASSTILFALIDIHLSFWKMAFFMMITICGIDVIYPIGNMQIAAAFDEDSQSLAGGIFNVTIRLATSLGLAVTSSISTATSKKYITEHPQLDPNSPEVLMVGFRAAGWTLLGSALIAVLIVLIWMRDLGVIGRQMLARTGTRVSAQEMPMNDIKVDSPSATKVGAGDVQLSTQTVETMSST
ncbi:major facilitator superfamily domain-containing protein [Phlebopus sp. FC_14]|nr:major facilitator superfamily domain-containing protein [Phlebopus sp. FC_14]